MFINKSETSFRDTTILKNRIINLIPKEVFKYSKIGDDGFDQIKKRADQIFIENVANYITDELALKALGMTKPILSENRLLIIGQAGVPFYTEIAKWFTQTALLSRDDITQIKEMKSKYPNCLEKYIAKFTKVDRKVYGLQFLLCYNYAMMEIFPESAKFIEHGFKINFQERLNKFSLNNRNRWLKDINISNFLVQLGTVKGHLDLIDPTMEISNQVCYEYIGAFIFKLMSPMNIINNEYTKNIVNSTLDIIYNSSATNPEISEMINNINLFIQDVIDNDVYDASDSNNAPVETDQKVAFFNLIKYFTFSVINPQVENEEQMYQQMITYFSNKGVLLGNMEKAISLTNLFYRIIQIALFSAIYYSDADNYNWLGNTNFSNDIIKATKDGLEALYIKKKDSRLINFTCKQFKSLTCKIDVNFRKSFTIFNNAISKLMISKISNVLQNSLASLLLSFNIFSNYQNEMETLKDTNWGNFTSDLSSAYTLLNSDEKDKLVKCLSYLPLSGLTSIATGLPLAIISLMKNYNLEKSVNDIIPYITNSIEVKKEI